MLSQYDRQQLEMISNRLRMDDPDLAKALREGKLVTRPADHRWPLVVLLILAGLVVVAGVLVGSFGFIFLGALAITAITVYFGRHVRRTGTPRVRQSRRRARD